jgi:hypothetical protein
MVSIISSRNGQPGGQRWSNPPHSIATGPTIVTVSVRDVLSSR